MNETSRHKAPVKPTGWPIGSGLSDAASSSGRLIRSGLRAARRARASKPSVLLRPYGQPARDRRWARLGIGVVAIVFCFFYGAAFALVAPNLLIPLAIPILILGGVAIWSLPNANNPPIRLLEFLLYAFFISLVLWPNYLAVAIPGLPWITVLRLVSAPLALTLVVCVSASTAFRARLAAVLRGGPLVWKAICLFAFVQIVSVAISVNKVSSATIFLSVFLNQFLIFFASCFVLNLYNRVERFSGLLWLMGIVLCVAGISEFRLGHVLWVGHIPSFLKVQDPNVDRFLHGTTRGGASLRVQVTYTTSLGLSEYLGVIAYPFVIHFAVQNYRRLIRIAAIVTLPVMVFVVVLTQARVGMIGVVVATLAYPFILQFLRWRRKPANLTAAAAVFLAPLSIPAALAFAYAVPGIRIRILGGGAAQLSNEGRSVQMHMGLPKILERPWGYGLGQGAEVLGYAPSGFLTIDSYSLRLALEYGLVGLAAYYFIFVAAEIYLAHAVAISSETDRRARILIPISISILSYLIVRSVYAAEDNQPIMYMLLAMSLVVRHKVFS